MIESVCLGVGEAGSDPELIFPGGTQAAVVDTFVELTPDDGSLRIHGPYVVGDGDADRPALALRWGIRSPRGHFLLFAATHLQLPALALDFTRRRHVGALTPSLTLTVSISGGGGEPLLGVIDADDLAWQLPLVSDVAHARPRSAAKAEQA